MTHQTIVEADRRYRINCIQPQAQEWKDTRTQPTQALCEAAELVLLAFETPQEFGGPGAGSDFSGISTLAEKNNAGLLLNGTKAWITNAAIAEIFIVYAQTIPAGGWHGIASFLVDARKPGFRRGDIYRLLGGHAIGPGEFHLENFQAAEEDLLSPPGEAFKHAMSTANGLRQDSSLGRHLAGAKIAAFTDGSTEMMNERIGASIRRQRQ